MRIIAHAETDGQRRGFTTASAAWRRNRHDIIELETRRNQLYLPVGASMKFVAIVIGSLLFATPVPARSISDKPGVNSTPGIAPTNADLVKEVAISDMLEIESSQLARHKGGASEKIIRCDDGDRSHQDQHRAERHGQQRQGQGRDTDQPRQRGSEQARQAERLKGANRKDFSSDHYDDQRSAHKDADNLFERYAKSGDQAELNNWAGKTPPALKHHLEMARNWKK